RRHSAAPEATDAGRPVARSPFHFRNWAWPQTCPFRLTTLAGMGAGQLRRAHVALAIVFVGFGTIDGSFAARLPALKHRLGLDSGELGLVIFCVSVSATLLLPAAG